MAALARIVPFLRGFRLKLVLMFGLALLGVGLSTLYPLVGRYLVDQVLVPRNEAGLVPALGALVGLALIGWLIRGLGRTLNALTTAEILIAMRTHLFSHLLRLPQSFFVRARTGDLVARLHQDLTEAQRVATDVVPGLLAAALSALASLGMLLYLDWRLTLATLSVAPFMLLTVSALRAPLRRGAMSIRDAAAQTLAFAVESVGRVRMTAAYDCQDEEVERYRQHNLGILGALRSYQWLSVGAGSLPPILVGVAGMVVFYWGGRQVLAGQMTVGDLLAYAAYQVRFFAPVQDLARGGFRLATGRAALDRVFEVLDLPPADPPELEPQTVSGPIEWDQVSFAYPGRGPLLERVSLRLDPGEIVALTGPNGVGKTTLIWLLLGFEKPASGAIRIGGIALDEIHPRAVRRAVTLVPQEAYLLNASLEDNLRFADPQASQAELDEAAALAGIELPLSTLVGERGLALSDGQRQRVALARGLLRKTPVLILDEATSAVDGPSEARLFPALRERGLTVLVLAHRDSTVEQADRVVRLEAGRVVEAAPC